MRSMRRPTLLAGLVLVIGMLLPGSALAAAGGSDLPFKGSVSGTSAHNLLTGQVHAVSTGEVTHLGLTAVEQSATFTGGPTTFVLSVTATLTAANGDKMYGATAGTCTRPSPTSVQCSVVFTSSGGTGRFAHASATFTIAFLSQRVDFVSPISYGEHTATLDGHMSW